LPFLTTTKAEIAAGAGRLMDRYYSITDIKNTLRYDYSNYNQVLGSLRIINNTLNYKQYATLGNYNQLLAQSVTSWEEYIPGTKGLDTLSNMQSWLQFSVRINNFHPLTKRFTLGYLAEGVLSSKNLSATYTSSIIQAPAFTPTPHSSITFHDAYRANEYLAAGIVPIVNLTKMIHFRSEVYAFMPIFPIQQVGPKSNDVRYGNVFSDIHFMGEFSVVLQLPFTSIAVYANTYDYPFSKWNFGLNIGYLIFNPRFHD